MKTLIAFFLIFSIQIYSQETIKEAINTYNSNSITYISVEELNKKLSEEEDLYLIDTREKAEFEVSHLKDAIWVGYSSADLSALENIDKSSTLVVYCSIGVRSEEIGEKLAKKGYKNIFNLYGGIFEWVNASNPVYNLNHSKTMKVHAFDKFWGKLLKKGIKVYE
jgi:rhodanese-related sulfurtransferase